MFIKSNLNFSGNPTISDDSGSVVLVGYVEEMNGKICDMSEVYLSCSEDPICFTTLHEGIKYFKEVMADFELDGVERKEYRQIIEEVSALFKKTLANRKG